MASGTYVTKEWRRMRWFFFFKSSKQEPSKGLPNLIFKDKAVLSQVQKKVLMSNVFNFFLHWMNWNSAKEDFSDLEKVPSQAQEKQAKFHPDSNIFAKVIKTEVKVTVLYLAFIKQLHPKSS